jgi:peptide-methionine (S)-S-oxide reductase
MSVAYEEIVLGGGCFWCLEAAYEIVDGVLDVESGYSGGSTKDPSYEEVSSGRTGHAEVVRIRYDPSRIGLERIFDLFFLVHDPTTKDRQGADIGTQYRSIVLYANEAQRLAAEKAISLEAARWPRPIVTELKPLDAFYPAEEYHQDFYRKNPDYGYCRAVVRPKVEKVEKATNQA